MTTTLLVAERAAHKQLNDAAVDVILTTTGQLVKHHCWNQTHVRVWNDLSKMSVVMVFTVRDAVRAQLQAQRTHP